MKLHHLGPRTLAWRLFWLMWAALVLSHLAAFTAVHGLALGGPPPGPPPGHAAGPSPDAGPPLPVLGSLPPSDGLPTHVLLLDYGVRLVVIEMAAWWGSRWLAGPMARLVQASEALGPALARGQPTPPLDEHHGTLEVRTAATVFNRMAAQIRQQFLARGVMVAAISHDLRTPLTRMRLRLETAAVDDGLRQRCVDDLREMNALIDTVLDVFRGPEGELPPLQRTDVTALVQALVDDRAELGQAVELSGEAAPALVDPRSLRRVPGNLVDNALRYAGNTTLQAGHDAHGVWVRVEDRGPGIPPDMLDAVLQPFVRVDSSRHRNSGGAGLGLFIAQELTQRMGGTLTLRNREGGGLSAQVWLPRVAGPRGH